ncbi:MAG: hypothetical protein AAGG01_15655 [Planctomycetota bacterium]
MRSTSEIDLLPGFVLETLAGDGEAAVAGRRRLRRENIAGLPGVFARLITGLLLGRAARQNEWSLATGRAITEPASEDGAEGAL